MEEPRCRYCNHEIELVYRHKYCKCGCVVSGNYHVNTDKDYTDESVFTGTRKKFKYVLSELGTIWVIKCKEHGCTKPKAIN